MHSRPAPPRDQAIPAKAIAGQLRDPEDMPWGERIAVFDPDGNPVTLYQEK
jgi:hypothetical protein